MNTLGIAAVLVLLVGTWAQTSVRMPMCDSPEAEDAARAARDHLNAQHTHGYKYEVNRIEDIKVYSGANGDDTYVLEVDLLETDCHMMDPTPVANCTVRPKILTSVEGDCDVVLKKVGGVLSVTAFKCKTEESTEDLCVGCLTLLPLNDTVALDFLHASVATFNNNTVNVTYAVLDIGRMSSQIVSGGIKYFVEYVIVEANCTNGVCVPLSHPTAERGFCSASGFKTSHKVDCKMFHAHVGPAVDANGTVSAAPVHVHKESLSRRHGLRHHKLTALHDPHLSGFLSAESAESTEGVPVAAAAVDPAPAAADPAPAADSASASVSKEVFKRDLTAAIDPLFAELPKALDPVLLLPRCPGRIRFFD